MSLCGLGADSTFLFSQQFVFAEPVQPAWAQNVMLCAAKKNGEWGNYSAFNVEDDARYIHNTFSLLFEMDTTNHLVDVSDDNEDVEMAIIFVGSADADGNGAKLENMIIYSQSWDGNEPLRNADLVISDFLSSGLLTIPVVTSAGSYRTLPSVVRDTLAFVVDQGSDISPTFFGCLGYGVPLGSLDPVQRDSLYTVSGEIEGALQVETFDTRFGIQQNFYIL